MVFFNQLMAKFEKTNFDEKKIFYLKKMKNNFGKNV